MDRDYRKSRSQPGGALTPQPRAAAHQPAYPTKGLQIRPPPPSKANDLAAAPSQQQSTWQTLPRKWELSDFKPIKKLYNGYASKVYLAEDCGKLEQRNAAGEVRTVPGTGRKIVLKVYDLLRLSPLTKYQLDREVRLHTSVQHKNIVRLLAAFEQTDFCILVQDYARNGDLYSHLHKNNIRLAESKLVSLVMLPCLEALKYLHSRNIIHRDIKPENLLLDEHNVIKVADFGLSVSTDEENPVTRAGTLDYMAPEVLVCPLKRLPTDYKQREDLAYGAKVDSWSLGVLAYELLTGRPPFHHKDEVELLQAIKRGDVRFPANISASAKEWVRAALVMDVTQRASVGWLMQHPWIIDNSGGRRPSAMPQDSASGMAPSDSNASEVTATASAQSRPAPVLALSGNSSISPAMTAIRLTDEASTPTGCRSPAALHLASGGDTPTPFRPGDVRAEAPDKSPGSSSARSRPRHAGPSLATRALSSLNPARASGVIGNIFGHRQKDEAGSKQSPSPTPEQPHAPP